MKNQVNLIGRIGNEIELKTISENNKAINLSIAVDESYLKDKEKVEQVSWFNAVAYNKVAELITKHFSKGDQIAFQGKLKSRTYENENGKNYVVEIIIENIEFLACKIKSKED